MSLPDVILLDDALPPIVIEDDAGRQLEIITDPTGPKGDDGLSAYELAVTAGFVGTLEQWLDSLDGRDGGEGLSAYGLAVAAGFAGTVEEWLASLRGADGEGVDGSDGQSAYDLAVASGFVGTMAQWLASLKGADGEDGASAYEVALEEGFVGTPDEWLESLRGPRGNDGADSTVPGPPGDFDPTELEANIAAVAEDLLGVAEVANGVQEALVTTNQNLDNLFGRVNGHDEALAAQGARLDDLEAAPSPFPGGGTAGQVLASDGESGLVWVDQAGGGGETWTRQALTHTTPPLVTGARQVGALDLAPSYRLLRVSTDRPARVRFYTTPAKRDADLDRAIGAKPTGDHGRIGEFITTSELPGMDCSPLVDGQVASGTSSVPFSIVNTGAAGTITLTLTWIRTE